MSYKHLTIKERNKIKILYKEGYSSRKIAKILGYHHTTISRELKRCKDKYKTIETQTNKVYLSSLKRRKSKVTNDLKQIITEKLNIKWSPE